MLASVHDFGFERGQRRVGVHVVERAEELLLGQFVTVRAVAADADAQRAGRASLPLRLPDRVQNALAHAFQVAVGAAQVVELAGHGVLNILVLAAAALEDQLDLDLVLFPLLEVHHRRLFAQIVAAVLAGERIHRIRPQLAQPRSFGHRLADGFPDADLVHAHRRVHDERGHAGVLADGAFVIAGHIDIGEDNIERLRRLRSRRLRTGGQRHGGADIRRKIGRGLHDEFQQTGG